MKAEIIAVGSELLTPDHLDTNSLLMTDLLNGIGIDVRLKLVVGDDLEDLCEVFRQSLERSDVILFSGGLGPTEDDLTRQAVARVLGRALSVDPTIVQALRQRFASRGYEMPKINERQAEVIEGAEILPNANGTAPGMWISHEEHHIALLPGPPRELKPMLETQVIPRLRPFSGGRRVEKRHFVLGGMTESEVDSRVAPIYTSYPSIRTTILAHAGQISLKMERWLREGEQPTDLEELAARIRKELGAAVFTEKGESLEEVVGRMLLERGTMLAVAESCTSGMIAGRITRVPGSSRYFLGGVLCYSNELKLRLCGVPAQTLAEHGAVSPETAAALAEGIRRSTGAAIGLSVTGIAGPGGGSPDKPVGLVYAGLSDESRTIHHRRVVPGDRDSMRERTASWALALLRRFLLRT
jgi:nicotinamide-nucleotide amidase